MSNAIKIEGLRGTIYRRGQNSYRVQLSLGRNAEGRYDIKRETVRRKERDAIDLLARWNVEFLDNTIIPTEHQTVEKLYEEWIKEVKLYLEPNTYRFYTEKWKWFGLTAIGHKRLKDVTLRPATDTKR